MELLYDYNALIAAFHQRGLSLPYSISPAREDIKNPYFSFYWGFGPGNGKQYKHAGRWVIQVFGQDTYHASLTGYSFFKTQSLEELMDKLEELSVAFVPTKLTIAYPEDLEPMPPPSRPPLDTIIQYLSKALKPMNLEGLQDLGEGYNLSFTVKQSGHQFSNAPYYALRSFTLFIHGDTGQVDIFPWLPDSETGSDDDPEFTTFQLEAAVQWLKAQPTWTREQAIEWVKDIPRTSRAQLADTVKHLKAHSYWG